MIRTATVSLALCLCLPSLARAQELPSCDGRDPAAAAAEFEEGNALLQQATAEARARHRERAVELATQALAHFDAQCADGDESAMAERGAALMLMGEALRSAQSFDAYLQAHPLSSLDARTRRRIEPNLQPGTVTLEGSLVGRLFVDDLDFGPLDRSGPLHLPYGDHLLEAHGEDGTVVASSILLNAENPTARFEIHGTERPTPERLVRTPERSLEPIASVSPRTDYVPFEAALGAGTAVFLVLGIALQLGADGRAQTYNATCVPPDGVLGCDAVLSEYDGFFAGAISSYVLSGALAISLGVVLGLDLSQPSGEGTSMRCSPSVGGLSCSGTF